MGLIFFYQKTEHIFYSGWEKTHMNNTRYTTQNEWIQLFHMDCIEGAKIYLPDNSADLVIADPPYNLGFGGTTQTRTKRPRFSIIANDQLKDEAYSAFMNKWLRQAYRVLKPGRHLYVFIDWRMYPHVALWTRSAGFVIKNCIVWDKVNMGLGWQYRFQHEFLLFAVKPAERVRRIGTRRAADIWKIPRISGNKTIHPTEKPVELLRQIILNSSTEGELVADFFCGSGPSVEAAWQTGRKLVAFEIDSHWFEVSKERILRLHKS